MTLNEFRLEMALYRQSVDDEAKSLKNPHIALERLRALYRKLDTNECQRANQVLSEWALSDDEGLRFDALALIDELRISTTVPALYELAARIALSTAPSAPYELEKVKRTIDRLGDQSPPKSGRS